MDDRLKRLRMRSWRRGTKEMDLILGPFADARLEEMTEATLAIYERLLEENDQELITWVIGTGQVPDWATDLIGQVKEFAFSHGVSKKM
jgi:antitoxin CptB